MLKAEARTILGRELCAYWQHPGINDDIKRRFWEQDFDELQQEAIRVLFGAPEWDIPELDAPDADEPRAIMLDLATATAIASERYDVGKVELLAAIGLGEVEGIAPGSKELERDALIDWLEAQAQVVDEPVEDEPLEMPECDVKYEVPQLTWWQASGHALFCVLGTIACVAFVVWVFCVM